MQTTRMRSRGRSPESKNAVKRVSNTRRRKRIGRPGPTLRESAAVNAQLTPRIFAAWAAFSCVAIWASLPPLGFWWLAWIAPVGWLRIISTESWTVARPYRWLYGAGFVHWMLLNQWIQRPHWSANFGWVALAIYLGMYIPVFIGTTRVAVHRLRLPVFVAAPITWVGLELARGHLLTGFSLSLLGHTQVAWLSLIQVADVFGAYGVSFIVMLVAAAIERAVFHFQSRSLATVVSPLLIAAVVVGSVLAYGHWRLSTARDDSGQSPARIALIQGSFDTQFDNPETAQKRSDKAFSDYQRLTRKALNQFGAVDLVVWPESMFTNGMPLITVGSPPTVPPSDWDSTPEEYRLVLARWTDFVRDKMRRLAREVGGPSLVGCESNHLVGENTQRYNSAVYIDEEGTVAARYDKMHRVMFGEYVPFGEFLPWLYFLTPMPNGLTRGEKPITISAGSLRLSPSICFENTVPHLIRNHVRRLRTAGDAPDALLTITNDGWFWGSSLLDLHLTCGIFRAVENRMPMVIAANTGFSASIDGSGRVLKKGPRRNTAVLLAEPQRDGRATMYAMWGDWPATGCLGFVILTLAIGLRDRYAANRSA